MASDAIVVGDTLVDFRADMKVPGCEHVCPNAQAQAVKDMGPRYKVWLQKSRHVANVCVDCANNCTLGCI